jgi:hypothetical protein
MADLRHTSRATLRDMTTQTRKDLTRVVLSITAYLAIGTVIALAGWAFILALAVTLAPTP